MNSDFSKCRNRNVATVPFISLEYKSRNMAEFLASEIESFCKVVGVTTRAEKERIFFG